MARDIVTEASTELDEIYSLLAYALVYKQWQPERIDWKKRRGYNIGAVLVSPDKAPVQAGLNCVTALNDATQHGELRAITGYLSSRPVFDLQGFTLYATLEPCVMCAGMMIMTSLDRVVFGQRDVEYSKALERLSFDGSQTGGFLPYPRTVKAQPSTLTYVKKLDEGLQRFLSTEPEKILARFLASAAAEAFYQEAYGHFIHFKTRHPVNEPFLNEAHRFLKSFKHEPTG